MTGDSNTTQPEKTTAEADTAKAEAATISVEKTTETITPKPSPKAPTPPTEKKTANTRKKPWLLIAIAVLLLLLVGGIGAGAYFGMEQWEQQQQRFSAMEDISSQTDDQLKTLIQKQDKSLKTQQQLISQLLQDQKIAQQQLDSHGQRLSSLSGTSRDDWLLAEASYLLRLANQRILVERAPESAIGLLETADDILSGLSDRELLPVRQAIAQEVVDLKLANNIDLEGTYLQLGALKKSLQALPLVPFIDQTPSEASNTAGDAEDADESFLQSVKDSFLNLGQYIEIKSLDQAPDLLISERQQLQVINNLSLMFEQAQFALLHEEQTIYQESMQQAIDWWKAYYAHYPEYETVKGELEKFASLSIIQQLPDISRSAALLQDYIERYHRLNLEDKDQPKESK